MEMARSRVLVIAYGNPVRGDDGLAWRAAEQVKKLFPSADVEVPDVEVPDVNVLERHQLVPELAEDVSRSLAVIFVDAAAAQPGTTQSGEVHVAEITDREVHRASESPFHHQFSPMSLLALAAELYGAGPAPVGPHSAGCHPVRHHSARPRAFVATLTGENFAPGERLSPVVERAMPEFVRRIEELIRKLLPPGR
jgi:hydrogenase maturation protease